MYLCDKSVRKCDRMIKSAGAPLDIRGLLVLYCYKVLLYR